MMLRMNSSACYVLLVVCVNAAFAQFGRPQTQPFNQQGRLSPQQQGHILSDVQQHHRFNPPQNLPPFAPQQFSRNKPPLSPQQTQFFPRNPEFRNPHSVVPTLQTFGPQSGGGNRVVQHHTQTGFNPNYPVQPTQQQQQQQLQQQQQQQQQQLQQQQLQQQQQQQQQVFNQNFRQQLPPTPETLVNSQQQLDPEQEKQRLKDLQEKQAIIEKHNQFVEKQYEKALKKAQSDHLDFVKEQQELKKKLYQKLYRPNGGQQKIRYSQSVPRYIFPEEAPLFQLSLQKYYEEHPTTTTTTTTTTTPAPSTTTEEEATDDDEDSMVDSSRSEFFAKKQPAFLPTAAPAKLKPIQSLEDLSYLQKQYKSQQIRKDELLAQLKQAIGENVDDGKNLTSREISLGNGQKAQLIRTSDPGLIPSGEGEDIVLANGQKVKVIKTKSRPVPAALNTEEITLPDGTKAQLIKTTNPEFLNSDVKTEEITLPDGRKAELIKTTNPNLLSGSSIKTEEITLPDGRKAELIKTTDPKLIPGATRIEPGSNLEKLVFGSTTTAKPPTQIFEELTKDIVPAGANFELLKHDASGGLEQIEGLPTNLPSQKKVTFVLLEEQSDGTFKVQGVKGNGGKDKSEVDVDSILKKIKNGEIKLPPPPESSPLVSSTTERNVKVTKSVSTVRNNDDDDGGAEDSLYSSVTISPNAYSASVNSDTPVLKTNIGTNFVATTPVYSTTYSRGSSTSTRSTTPAPKASSSPSNDLIRQASSSSTSNHNSLLTAFKLKPTNTPIEISSVSSTFDYTNNPATTEALLETTPAAQELVEVLRNSGLYAMARFLRQSGLDTILNETGPYTIFAPTDKAFKTLLIQLGGPEKAEEKFKENPRLLSGLLLHHVIPGAFTISSLQDEMTGVSLAGTQLRVNQYNMHDVEWNDVKITTINGAKILEDQKDIEIPQGVAHAVDRVMFPLPVGDIVQTLQSDRERRFTSFLRALFSSGLAESLQGTKTFTVFAPTDKAFASLPSEDLTRTVSDRVLARELVKKHIVPGTLYTNGMRYYQIKDSLEPNNQLTLSKTLTKIKVNNVPISTSNIPATNGVIHAVDEILLSY